MILSQNGAFSHQGWPLCCPDITKKEAFKVNGAGGQRKDSVHLSPLLLSSPSQTPKWNVMLNSIYRARGRSMRRA